MTGESQPPPSPPLLLPRSLLASDPLCSPSSTDGVAGRSTTVTKRSFNSVVESSTSMPDAGEETSDDDSEDGEGESMAEEEPEDDDDDKHELDVVW